MAELIPLATPPVRADLWPHPLTAEGRVRAEAFVPDAGAPLLEVLTLLGTPPAAPLIVTVNGRVVPASAWATHRLHAGDLVLCRARLQGGDTSPLQILLTIGVLALGGWAGATIGGVAGSLVAGAIVTVGGLLVNALFPPALPDAGEKAKPLYSLTGGANRARPYEPVLMTLGTHRVYPDIAGAHYVEFVGGEQYLHQVFDFGVGDLDITDIRIGDTPLGAYNRARAAGQDTVTHNSDYGVAYTRWRGAAGANALADVEQQLALPGEAITLVAEDVDTITGAKLTDTAWHTRTSSINASRIALDFGGFVVRTTKKGKLRSHTVALTVQYREVGQSSWTTRPATQITNGNQDPVRVTWFIDLPSANKQWQVRVRRNTAVSKEVRTRDDITWSVMRTYQASTANAAGRTRLALRIKATGQLNGRLDRLSALVSARVPVWDKDAATWSAANAASSNPADILRQFASGIKDAQGRLIAGAGLSLDQRIDLASIQAWREWCDTENLALNYVVDGPMSLDEALQLITRAGRASHSWHSGKLGVVFDQADRAPTTLITAGNILAGSVRSEWADGRVADEIVAEYTDPNFDWQPVTLRRKVTGVVHPQRSARIRLPGVTSRDQAIEETNLAAARQHYHRRRITWAMSMEGFALLRGEVVYLSEALVSGGQTGRLLGGDKAQPTLDAPITVSAGTDYLLLRLADGTLHTSVVAGAPGETDRPTLATPLPGDPADGGLGATADPGVQARDVLWRYYSAANPPLKVKIIGLRPRADSTVEITAIDEVAQYYAAKDLALTDPLPKRLSRLPKVLDISVSETLVETGGGYTVEIVVALTVEGDWRGGVIWAQLDSQARRVVATLSAQETRGAWIEQPSGMLTITAVPGSDVAPTGQALSVTHEILGINIPPDAAANMVVTGVPGGYEVTWDDPDEPDYAVTEIYDAAGSVAAIADATVRGEVAGTYFLRLGLSAAADLAVWVRHRDRSGNTGEAVRTTVTTLAAGAEGVGEEHIFTANATGAKITGSANLPLASWNYDQAALDTGITRGTQTYYDGTPSGLDEDTPYMIRFRRPIKGSPAQDEDIGTVPWTQDPAVRVYGEPGVGEERIFTATALGGKITGSANLPLAAWHYKQDGLATGLTRGTQTYYDRTPADLGNAKRFLHTFRRPIEGSPAANTDIGTVTWVQDDSAIRQIGTDGKDGTEGVGVEYIFTSSATGAKITAAADLPLASWNYDQTALDNGITRRNYKYYDGTPPNISASRPYVIRFRRPVRGAPARDEDIGTVAWTQDPATYEHAEDGTAGVGIDDVTATTTGVTIELTDGTTTDVTINQVTDVSRNVDTGVVTVTYSDGTTDTFTVADGRDGGAANLGGLLIQRIYRRTATSIKPTLPTSSTTNRRADDYVPTDATSRYVAPSQTLPYAWIAYRYGVKGNWTVYTDWQSNGFHKSALDKRSAVTYQPVATTATSWSNQLANNTTAGDNVPTDMVTQYNDKAKWTETRYWSGSAWVVVDIRLSENYFFEGSIGARFLSVENLAALNVKVKNADIEGVIQAEHISADVFNVSLLWTGSFVVPSAGNTTNPLTLINSQDLDDWDTLLILAKDIVGTDRGFVSTMVPVSLITANSQNSATEMLVGSRDFTIGRNGAGTQVYPAGAGGSSRISVHKIWGLKDPGGGSGGGTTPPTPVAKPALSLADSGTIRIAEGTSRLFRFNLDKAASGAVRVTCTLSGQGAGSDISFQSGSSDISETVTITAGNTAGSVTVYARDQDSTDDATLTISTTTAGIDVDSSKDSVDIDVSAAPAVYRATVTAANMPGWEASVAAQTSYLVGYMSSTVAVGTGFWDEAFGSISVSDTDSRISVLWLHRGETYSAGAPFDNRFQVGMPRGASQNVFTTMRISGGGRSITARSSDAQFSSSWTIPGGTATFSRWFWDADDDADNIIRPGSTFTVEFFR